MRQRLVLAEGKQVLAVFAIAVLAVLAVQNTRGKSLARVRAQALVERTCAQISAELEDLSASASLIAACSDLRAAVLQSDPARCAAACAPLAEALPDETSVLVQTVSGEVLYASSRDAESAAGNVSVDAATEGQAVWSSSRSGAPVLVASARIAGDGGQAVAVVQRRLDAGLLVRVAERVGQDLAVWDRSGNPVGWSDEGRLPDLGEVLSVRDQRECALGGTVVASRRIGQRRRELAAWTIGREDMPRPIAYVAAVCAEGTLIPRSTGTVLIVSGLGVTLLLLRVLSASRFSSRLAADVAVLSKATDEIAAGNLDRRIQLYGSRELASLGDAFNRMADVLRDSRQQLIHSENVLFQMTLDLRRAYEDSLTSLATALDTRDNETQEHSYRVMEYALCIARQMQLSDDELADIERGALLHDIGKIGIPDSILLKPGPLTEREWEVMQTHPRIGFEMLAPVDFLGGAAEIVYTHHERWDGTGYPRGLAGEEIPLGGRVFTVADTFDAITSNRPYRRAQPYEVAVQALTAGIGRQFDRNVIAAFLRISEETWQAISEDVAETVLAHKERSARRIAQYDRRRVRPPTTPAQPITNPIRELSGLRAALGLDRSAPD